MKRRDLLVGAGNLGILAAMGMGVPGISGAQALPQPAPVKGGILNMTIPSEPTTLVSAFNSTMQIGMVSSKILEGLVTYDGGLNPVPALAKSWTVSPDGLTIRFVLRENVKWHDGKDFTSADVEFTLLKVWKVLHPFGRAVYANVNKVDTPDRHTVILHLSAPAQYIFSYINTYGSQILPKHIYDGTDILTNPANAAPIGTGPFVFKEWQRGSHVRLERNANYWDPGRPYLDGIVIRFIPDAAARTVALEAGEIQLAVTSIPIPNLTRFADRKKYKINLDEGKFLSSIFLLQFNVRRPNLSDKRVRQAALHAIDREALVRLVWRGYGKPATGPIPSSVKKYYNGQTKQYPYDPKKAEQLLDAAGLKRGADGIRLKVTLDYGASSLEEERACQFIKQYLGKVGIQIELRSSDAATYLRRIFTDVDYDLMVSSLHMLPDPTLGVQRLYWTKNIVKAPWTNGSGYSNPTLDRIMEAAGKEADDGKRKELFRQWQEIAQEDLPILDLVELTWVNVSTARMHKVNPQGDGLFASFSDVFLTPP
ncbi:ABC transporter substrate-binding protein [Glaciimonas sp. PCH181]|uniref:ABC transporter substrate-binding protein n=1 Tax=Glaciimonas sp. PCH181 TaxID=2133943 RepID=UPI0013750482|nr:ABC transporter substrate-binding protein [Glaciimonas sp. PCH181]